MPGEFYPGQLYPGRAYAPLTQTVSGAGGIASAETWGTPTVDSSITVTGAGGIASGEAWGAPTVDSALTVSGAGGIASGEAWGVPTVGSAATISAAGGIASAEAWGTPGVTMDTTLSPGGIPSGEAWGVPSVSGAGQPSANLAGSRYPAGFYPGAGVSAVLVAILPGGIPSGEAWGVPSVSIAEAITAAGDIPSGEAWGVPSVQAQFETQVFRLPYPAGFYPGSHPFTTIIGAVSAAGGIPSAEAWGTPGVSSPQTILPGGIPSAEAWGVPGGALPSLLLIGARYPGGFYLGGRQATGLRVSAITPPGGIPSAEAWGTPGVVFTVPIGAAGGIPSAEAWGVPGLTLGIVLSYDPSGRRRPVGISCGSYDVEILSRGGHSRLLVLPATAIQWGRELDAVSQASINCDAISAACRRDLRGIDPWSHELALYRTGTRVWSGPLLSLDLHTNTSIAAQDLMAWLQVWRVWNDHAYPVNTDGTGSTDLATIWNAIIADAAQYDPVPGLAATATPCGVLGSYQASALEHRHADDDIAALSRTGIDWTVVDREVIAGGAALPLEPFAYLTDDDFVEPPVIRKDGSVAANQWGVRGAGSGAGADTTWAEYGPGDPAYAALRAAYGLLARDATDDHVTDSTQALAAAKTRWLANSRPPYVITDALLSPNAPVKINDLVPGRIVDLRLSETLEPVHTRYRMSRVAVSAQASGEEIRLSFEPVGTP